MPEEFDVFLSHNTRDKPLVEEIGARLRGEGLSVWLDKWELRPGFPWQEGLEEGVQKSRAVAVFVGLGGLGAWQAPEMRAFIARSRHEQVPVIPVLLPDCPDSPQLNLFLEAFAWVDLREGLTDSGFAQLVWGITGKKPEGMETVAESSKHLAGKDDRRTTARVGSPDLSRTRTRSIWWNWGIGLSLLGLALTLAAWLWPRSPAAPILPPKPVLYAVRVQIFDPHGQPVRGSRVSASVSNEPHQLLDGSWEIQIPAAKVPADGHISLRADHEDWEGTQVKLHLGGDPNPQAEIHLKTPETGLQGLVVDEDNKALPGVRVSSQNGTRREAITDAKGRFELNLSVPAGKRVGLRVEHTGSAPKDTFCIAGSDNCSIILDKR